MKPPIATSSPVSTSTLVEIFCAFVGGVGVGLGVGVLFAFSVLSISVASFPLLLDRDVGLDVAVWTSIRAVVANPGPMLLWGLIVACSLLIGSIPAFLGLVFVLPVLGHATWHLYRKLVEPSTPQSALADGPK